MLVERFPQNPLIKPADVTPSRNDFEVVCAFNPAVIEYDGKTLLLLRVAERPADKADDEQAAPIYNPETGKIEIFRVKNDTPGLEVPDSRSFSIDGQVYLTSISHLRIARSDDGINFTIDPEPAVMPACRDEEYGLEDPRITNIDGTYYITYKVVSGNAIATSLLTTTDFKNFKRLGMIFCAENLDVALFPEKIDGKFVALTRPVPRYIGKPTTWLAVSPDAVHWGGHKQLLLPRKGYFDSEKTGSSCVPFKTEKGWLEIYHGSDENGRYSLGAALLDSKDPSKILARSKEPLMFPEADYEKTGFYGNVVFSCGCEVKPDGKVIIYYGAADEYTAGAETSVDKIMSTLE